MEKNEENKKLKYDCNDEYLISEGLHSNIEKVHCNFEIDTNDNKETNLSNNYFEIKTPVREEYKVNYNNNNEEYVVGSDIMNLKDVIKIQTNKTLQDSIQNLYKKLQSVDSSDSEQNLKTQICYYKPNDKTIDYILNRTYKINDYSNLSRSSLINKRDEDFRKVIGLDRNNFTATSWKRLILIKVKWLSTYVFKLNNLIFSAILNRQVAGYAKKILDRKVFKLNNDSN
jgi:hypothetical protein